MTDENILTSSNKKRVLLLFRKYLKKLFGERKLIFADLVFALHKSVSAVGARKPHASRIVDI
jgi:hypothetical protein